MPVFTIDFEGREWTLDTDSIDTKELGEVERITGIAGIGFLETLTPTMSDGSPIPLVTVLNEKGKPVQVADPSVKETDLRVNVPSAVLTAMWWLFQRHAGVQAGPIDQVSVPYLPFLTALLFALAKDALQAVQAEEEDDPKDGAPVLSTGESGSSPAPTSPSFS